jgi:multiple sugar transport system permease protein
MASTLSFAAPARRGSPLTKRRSRAFYLFISPWLIGTVLLTIFPLVYALGVSLTDWDGVSPGFRWVGAQNYLDVLGDPETWASMSRSAVLAVVVVPLTVAGSLGIAILLNQKVRLMSFWRTMIYLPAVFPPVASALSWKLVFDRDSGAINAIRAWFGQDAVNWMTGQQVFVVLLAVMLWGIGAGMIINLAALQDVSPELLEAATLDGAGPWRRFMAVTLPTISPVLLFQTVTSTIGVLQTFVPALLLSPTTGAAAVTAVPEANRIFMIDVYAQYFAYSRYGYASAMLWLFFLAILVVTVLFFRASRKTVFYSVDPSSDGAK